MNSFKICHTVFGQYANEQKSIKTRLICANYILPFSLIVLIAHLIICWINESKCDLESWIFSNVLCDVFVTSATIRSVEPCRICVSLCLFVGMGDIWSYWVMNSSRTFVFWWSFTKSSSLNRELNSHRSFVSLSAIYVWHPHESQRDWLSLHRQFQGQ